MVLLVLLVLHPLLSWPPRLGPGPAPRAAATSREGTAPPAAELQGRAPRERMRRQLPSPRHPKDMAPQCWGEAKGGLGQGGAAG